MRSETAIEETVNHDCWSGKLRLQQITMTTDPDRPNLWPNNVQQVESAPTPYDLGICKELLSMYELVSSVVMSILYHNQIHGLISHVTSKTNVPPSLMWCSKSIKGQIFLNPQYCPHALMSNSKSINSFKTFHKKFKCSITNMDDRSLENWGPKIVY